MYLVRLMPLFLFLQDCVPSLGVGVYTKLVGAMKAVDELNLSLMNIMMVINRPNDPFSFSALSSIQVTYYDLQ